MNSFVAAGAGFLLAVLWFDLMFDVQTHKHPADPLPPEVLASISSYYRRVTTEAYPMNRLVALVMSSHLAILSRAALVTAQRFSRSIIYRADLKAFEAVMLFMLRDCCDGRPEICGPVVESLKPCCPPKTRRKAHV